MSTFILRNYRQAMVKKKMLEGVVFLEGVATSNLPLFKE